jgi:hypothetical protein
MVSTGSCLLIFFPPVLVESFLFIYFHHSYTVFTPLHGFYAHYTDSMSLHVFFLLYTSDSFVYLVIACVHFVFLICISVCFFVCFFKTCFITS